MPTLNDYLIKLIEERDDLVSALQMMSVDASKSESLQTLIPKILYIQQGDISKEFFVGSTITEIYPMDLGYLQAGVESAELAPHVSVTSFNRIGKVVVVVKRTAISAGSMSSLIIDADGWNVTSIDETTIHVWKEFAATDTPIVITNAFKAIKFTANNDIGVDVGFYVEGYDSKTKYYAPGSMEIDFIYGGTWVLVLNRVGAWDNVLSKSWSDLLNMRKV